MGARACCVHGTNAWTNSSFTRRYTIWLKPNYLEVVRKTNRERKKNWAHTHSFTRALQWIWSKRMGACMHVPVSAHVEHAYKHTHAHTLWLCVHASIGPATSVMMMTMMIIVMLNFNFCTTCCYDWYCVSSSSSSSSYLLHSALNCPFLLCWPPCVCLLLFIRCVVFIWFSFILFLLSSGFFLSWCEWVCVFSVSLHKRDRYFVALEERMK